MAKKMSDITCAPLRGLLDGPAARDVPPGFFQEALGYRFRDGFAEPERGRAAYTGSETVTGERTDATFHWVRPDGTAILLQACDGGIWSESVYGSGTFDTLISEVLPGGTAARVNLAVTFTDADNLDLTVREGDYFYYDADGPTAGGLVASGGVAAAVLTLSAYAGSETSGAYTVWRKLGSDISFAPCGDRLRIADGSGPLHWYGEDYDGSASWIFREVGLPQPADSPAIVLAAGGGLAAGDYFWAIAFGDARRRTGNAIETHAATALFDEKCSMSGISTAPAWATEVYVYRCRVDGTVAYSIAPDIRTKLKTAVYGSPTTVLTLDDEAADIVADMHIHRFVEFEDTGNTYRVNDNGTRNFTVQGDASGETGTAYVKVAGGFDLATARSSGIVDGVTDDELDATHPAPDYNDQPPEGLRDIVAFRGGGRWAAVKDETDVYFSGRPSVASRRTGGFDSEAPSGEGEFEYSQVSHDAGPGDGDEVQRIFRIGLSLYAAKKHSIWALYHEDDSNDTWQWYPIVEDVGMLSPKSLAIAGTTAFWLGIVAGEVDIVRFDGSAAHGIARHRARRPGLGTCLDSIADFDEPSGIFFSGMYWLSYPYGVVTTNRRTLRFDTDSGAWDLQPWGCGAFCPPFTSGTDQMLLCGAPDDVGHVYEPLGAAQDLSLNIERKLVTGDLAYPDSERQTDWTNVVVELEVTS